MFNPLVMHENGETYKYDIQGYITVRIETSVDLEKTPFDDNQSLLDYIQDNLEFPVPNDHFGSPLPYDIKDIFLKNKLSKDLYVIDEIEYEWNNTDGDFPGAYIME